MINGTYRNRQGFWWCLVYVPVQYTFLHGPDVGGRQIPNIMATAVHENPYIFYDECHAFCIHMYVMYDEFKALYQ